uniref:Putative GDSL family lipase n=1 Tax=uncultured bacterium fosmid pJB65E1 TaxID=1478066 RepID=A0A0H3UAI0_9BACT|nr:putative GDSL family lipase [uncultured bacterium fosmid pJB65E1]
MKNSLPAITALIMMTSILSCTQQKHWVATWATAEQIAEPHNCPPPPYLDGNSLRQIIQTSIPGEKVRLRFSNEFGTEPVEIKGAHIARAETSGSSPDIDPKTERTLLFAGEKSVTILPGTYVTCDPLDFEVTERDDIAITVHFGAVSASPLTSHPGSRTHSYIAAGETDDFSGAVSTPHWYIINDLEVLVPERYGAVVILGDSITDGRGSTTDGQDRWTDILSRRLLSDGKTSHLSVLNMGLGGNQLITGGLGPNGRVRYGRDLFGQAGVKYIVLFEGVNDIGCSDSAGPKVEEIISLYKTITEEAHQRGIKVIGCTVMPFRGNNYYSEDHEAGRQALNRWIRTWEEFDGVIDHAASMAAADDPERMDEAYLFENDWLHPNAAGHLKMGSSVDLSLFEEE